MRETITLGPGKSFGELALIMRKPRAATIRCLEDTHFATLDKVDYEKSLSKIAKKRLHKIVDFMTHLPCFKGWTSDSVIKFSYFLEKEAFQRNHILFNVGDKVDKVYIVKKGDVELLRKY
jgi:CRP-like cAMP-binding protein